jgi:hypothetical protein
MKNEKIKKSRNVVLASLKSVQDENIIYEQLLY